MALGVVVVSMLFWRKPANESDRIQFYLIPTRTMLLLIMRCSQNVIDRKVCTSPLLSSENTAIQFDLNEHIGENAGKVFSAIGQL